MMKKGDITDIYNSYSKEGIPQRETFFAKVELIKKVKPKHKMIDGFEFWQVKFIADILGNLKSVGHWMLHENGLQLIENLHIQKQPKSMKLSENQQKLFEESYKLKQLFLPQLPEDSENKKKWVHNLLDTYLSFVKGVSTRLDEKEFEDIYRVFQLAGFIDNKKHLHRE